jgi:hypothetical protein
VTGRFVGKALLLGRGHGVGSVTNDPKRICATCVGKSFRPSKIWVASINTGKNK